MAFLALLLAFQEDPVTFRWGWDLGAVAETRELRDASRRTLGGLGFGSDRFVTGAYFLSLEAGDFFAGVQTARYTGDSGDVHDPLSDKDRIKFTDEFHTQLLELDHLYVRTGGFRIGAQTYAFDIRGRGDALFLDLGSAESPWGEIGNAWYSVVHNQKGSGGVIFEQDGWAAGWMVLDDGIRRLGSSGEGSPREEVAFGAFVFDLDPAGGRAGVLVAHFRGPESESVSTFGGGFSFRVTSTLELFGEIYHQSGVAVAAGDMTLDGAGPFLRDVDAKGRAWRFGGRIDSEGPTHLWLETGMLGISGYAGAQTPVSRNMVPAAGETDEFISYENNDEMTILDSNEWGLDWDNNITQINLSAGIGLSTGRSFPHNLKIEVRFAVARADEDYFTEDDIGIEADLRIEVRVKEHWSLSVTWARLFSSDLLEDFVSTGKDSMSAIVIGTEAEF